MPDLEERLAAAEHDIARTVADVLREVATEFGQELSVADEIVAARFSVSRIARMFTDRMPRIVRRLLRISEEAATVSADAVDATLPAGWDDLPGRYDDDTLPEPFRAYVETTEHLLRAVGDRLADVATAELSEGVQAGETIDQLRARLRTAFDREGAQLGDTREERIARTEAGRAWNTATLATARAVTGPDRPIVKQWITRRDNRVRESHEDVNGQIRLVDEPFTVAGIDMDCPHDPTAPAAQVVNCRCVLALYPEIRSAAFDSQEAPSPRVFESQEPPVTTATSPALQAAADGSHLSGAMIALIPSEEDAQRLALDGGEDAAELHLTLFFLGQGADWSDESRADLIEQIRYVAADLGGPVHANAFGAAHWNADSDEPSWVWSVGDDRDRPGGAPTLGEARAGAGVAVEDARGPEIPVQHSPWQPHVCAVYSEERWPLQEMEERLGPITFDRIRVAFASDHTDIPIAVHVAALNPIVGGADVWNHGGHASTRNDSAGTAGSGCAHCGCGRAPADGMPVVRADTLQATGLDDLHVGREGAAGRSYPGGSGGALRTADPARGGRAPHVPHGPVRRADAPLPDPGDHAQRSPCRGADTDTVQRPSAAVRPAGRPGLGRMPGVPEGRHTTLGRTERGQAPGSDVLRSHGGQAEGIGEGVPQHAGVQGQGGSGTGRPPRPIERAEQARELTALGGRQEEAPMPDEETTAAAVTTRNWSTPDDTALAFENQETGDGRIFSAGALYWETGPWPLQYADEMLMGHEGAELAGAIDTVGRDGDRITGSGVLYANRPAGADACTLLDEGAPLGVSVDLDSVDVEFVDRTISEDEEGFLIYASAHLPQASLLRLEDGAWMLTARSLADWTAAGIALSRSASAVQLITGPGGTVSRAAVQQAFSGTGMLTAAAGDADDPDGVVVHAEQAGDFLLRITRARMRGATLVAMPAYDRARIVLDPVSDEEEETAAAVVAAASDDPHERVITYVSSSPLPVSPREVAAALDMRMDVAHGHLVRAAQSGRLVRLGRGQYVGASTIPEGPTVTAAGHEDLTELEASAWTAMRDTAPMPAAWFREPAPEELPPGSGGVHYRNGRIFGWVAQAGEPHAGHPGKKITIDGLGKLDLTHFLRARFKLDDGQTVRAGAFTMNVGHHRDGAECESAACQFDDTRTVAGIVTVGMSKGGLWFSGAAAPWLSEWDRQVFAACQPSYHMVKGRKGWQLRAVLSVPVPGHSSPLVATAIAERANLALTAAAAGLLTSGDTVSGHPDVVSGHDADTLSPPVDGPVDHTSAVAALLADSSLLDALTAAMARRDEERRAEAVVLAASIAPQPEETVTATSQGAH